MQMLHVLKLLLGDVHDSQLRAEAPVSLFLQILYKTTKGLCLESINIKILPLTLQLVS